MRHLKGLQRTIMASAVAVLAFGAAPAMAAGPWNLDTTAGTCTTGSTADCSTAIGHIGVSVVGNLSINEIRAMSFGNVTITGHGHGDGHVTLSPAGALSGFATGTDTLVLLSGQGNIVNNGLAGPGTEHGTAGNDGQRAGLFRVTGANEGAQTRVYISFADTSNNPLDCNTDTMYPNNYVTVTGPTATASFRVNKFTFAEAGNDVYGHYIVPAGAPAEGTVSGTTFAAVAGITAADIAVGATLNTDPNGLATPGPGKYVGEYNITASY